ncbi:hypothetical protein Hamer_G018618 [Homarus americanus]|uniref:Uncharacterized protein n=1 Tax=Homarus americanus TaxID=6706 RepID=A0A8J5T9W5_HOMAM|nr:hypothetical protein Hamer_G018618 [Homarus americanus]
MGGMKEEAGEEREGVEKRRVGRGCMCKAATMTITQEEDKTTGHVNVSEFGSRTPRTHHGGGGDEREEEETRGRRRRREEGGGDEREEEEETRGRRRRREGGEDERKEEEEEEKRKTHTYTKYTNYTFKTSAMPMPLTSPPPLINESSAAPNLNKALYTMKKVHDKLAHVECFVCGSQAGVVLWAMCGTQAGVVLKLVWYSSWCGIV